MYVGTYACTCLCVCFYVRAGVLVRHISLSVCLSVCLSVRSAWVTLLSVVCKLVRACVVIAWVGLKLVPLNIRVCMALAG